MDYSIRTMFDAVKNFGKVTVSVGYTNLDTVIVLISGDGARLPSPSVDGQFNLTWWNSTDYPDPADDPNREIVRTTTRAGDILTVTRAQEGILASNKNLQGKTYKMILALTAKLIPDIQIDAQTKVNTHKLNDVHTIPQNPTIHGGLVHEENITTKTSNYTITTSDDTVLCNASTSSFIVNLPDAATTLGRVYTIKKIDSSSNGITLSATGLDTIEGYGSLLIQTQWDYYMLQSVGTGWIIKSSTVIISMGQLNEFSNYFNSPPYTGLFDTLTRNESQMVYNTTPQSGLSDTLTRNESITYTN
jgi:hypothetical protein